MDPPESPNQGQRRIDPEKVRAAVRRMSKSQVFCLLDRAIDLLSQRGLLALVKGYVNPRDLLPDSDVAVDLVAAIRDFERRSLAGEYYEPFDYNYKTSNELSRGTEAWEADLLRFMERCLREEKARRHAVAREGLGILFRLLRQVDESEAEILFFADEGGSWMMGVDWEEVLPAWFRSLASTATPEEYARECRWVVDSFVDHDRTRWLTLARKIGKPEQRVALSSVPSADPGSQATL